MKTFSMSLLIGSLALGCVALADDTSPDWQSPKYVVYQKPKDGQKGVAEALASISWKDRQVGLLTESGRRIAIPFISRGRAKKFYKAILSTTPASIDVSECREPSGNEVSGNWNGGCSTSTYVATISCGLTDDTPIRLLRGSVIDQDRYELRDISESPIYVTKTYCEPAVRD